MKRAKYVMLVASMILFLSVSVNPNLLKADGGPLRAIQGTSCFDQETGVLTGYSNNCVQGEGDCVENGCADGQTEGPFTFPDPE